ncbi:hypothetical protein GCM10023196_017050 [Actinoallomurus vinaceus]|uniref:Uncharacterized protein n=1 Tax=Actinoallomurus vinaceus TaxID=1080074 RepID=A0ABP8U3A4_9ACTN
MVQGQLRRVGGVQCLGEPAELGAAVAELHTVVLFQQERAVDEQIRLGRVREERADGRLPVPRLHVLLDGLTQAGLDLGLRVDAITTGHQQRAHGPAGGRLDRVGEGIVGLEFVGEVLEDVHPGGHQPSAGVEVLDGDVREGPRLDEPGHRSPGRGPVQHHVAHRTRLELTAERDLHDGDRVIDPAEHQLDLAPDFLRQAGLRVTLLVGAENERDASGLPGVAPQHRVDDVRDPADVRCPHDHVDDVRDRAPARDHPPQEALILLGRHHRRPAGDRAEGVVRLNAASGLERGPVHIHGVEHRAFGGPVQIVEAGTPLRTRERGDLG